MKLGDIQTIVRAYVDDASADVDQCITDAVNFLNNFFCVKKTDTSQETTAEQSYIDEPTDNLKIRNIQIDDDFIKPLVSEEQLEDVDDESSQRWYVANGRIELTEEMEETGKDIIIWYDAEFTQPEAAVDTDVPNKLLELVYVGAAFRYIGIIMSKVISSRQDYPDVNPDEIVVIRNQWKEDLKSLLKSLT